jgi:hypothetical protein
MCKNTLILMATRILAILALLNGNEEIHHPVIKLPFLVDHCI